MLDGQYTAEPGGAHFLERGAKQDSLPMSELPREPDLHQVHAVREGGTPYGSDISASQTNQTQLLAVFKCNSCDEIEIICRQLQLLCS